MESISFKAKITGDISNLEKVLKVAEGQVRKLSDDEVLIKLAYDGNIKAFNKVFDGILKSCPELSIQFQYDVNKQLYLKELNKLESMQKLKIGIDSGDLKAELKEDMNSILAMWDNGDSEDKISGHLSKFRQKVANALKGGLLLPQNFMEPLEKMAEDSDTLMRVFDREYKPTIDLSNIKAQETRVKDISDHLDKLKGLGASDSGILSDTDIKIINDLNDKVVNLGERVELIEKLVNSITFDSATKSVDSLNSKLDETSKKVVDLQERLANPDNLTFHVGDFEGRGYKSEGFHRMISNMNAGGYDEGDVGFGVIGTGVYHTQNYSDLMMGGRNPKGYLLNIDPSKYNLLVAETNEEAEKLLQFLSDLQGFVIKMGSGYSAWDETLQSVDADSLYKRYTEIFKTANLDFKEFEGFLDSVVSQVKEASANGIDDEGFKDIPEKYVRADNIATQFLKRLGYGGVSLKGTQYDSYEQGNTVFDLDPNDIIKTFSSQGEMEDYGEKLAKRIQDSISTAAKNIDAGELKAAVEKCLGEDSDIKVNVVPDVDKLIVQLQAELDNAYVTIPVRPQDAQAFVDSLQGMVSQAEIKTASSSANLVVDAEGAELFRKSIQNALDDAPAVRVEVRPETDQFLVLLQSELNDSYVTVPVRPQEAQAFVDSLREMVTRADIKFSLGNVMLMPDEQPAVMARVVPDMEDFTSLAQAEIQGYSDPIKVPVKPEADEESVIGFAADLQKRLNQLEPFKIKVQPWNEDVDAISTSGEELLKESSALTSVFSEALKAAKAKEEFTKANAKLADGAKESSVAIADEYEQLGKIDIKSISATAQKTINGLFGDQPVDIYKQRRKDADGRYNVSYRVVGQDKTAYVGQNGTVLRDSERVLDNLTKEKALRKELQELERQQEKEEAALNAEQIKRFQAFEKEQSKYLSEQSQKEDETDRLKEQAIAYGLLANAVKDYGRMLNAIANGDYSLGDKDDAATMLDLIYEENDRLGSSKLGSKKLSDDIMNQIVKAEESAAKATEDFYSRQENAAKTSAEARIKYEQQVDEMWQKLLWKREQDEAKAAERNSEKNKSHNSSALDKLLSYGTRIDKDISDHKYVTEFADRLKDLRSEISAIKSEVDSGVFDFTTDESVKRLDELNAKLKETYASAGGEERAGNVTKLENNIKSIYKTLKDNSAMSAELRAKYEALVNEMESYSGSADISAAKTSDLTQRMIRLDAELLRTGQTGKGAFDIIGERLTGLNAQFIAQYFSIQDWIRYFRQAAQTVIELDTALTELRKVSDASTTRLQQSFRASAETAKELGSTISDVINVTADWSRLGETIDNAEDLARVTTLFKNVGDNITAEDASSYMISAMKGFKMQADEAEHIVDVYNEVANNFAIDTAGIGEAIKRSAASFAAANTSIEESVALVTAANSVAQDPASIGTAFKTMSARIRASKVELQELGEEEDAVVESTASLQKYIKGITGFDILEKDGKTFKSLYDILLGVGKEFQNLDDVTKAALSEKLFGKRMGNIGLAVLNDTEQLEAIYEKAMAAEGSAMREQENYAKSVQYSIDQLKASAQELANDVVNSQFLKGGIEALTKLVNIVDQLIKQFGILGPLVAGFGIGANAKAIGVQNIATALMSKNGSEMVYGAGKEIISKGVFEAVSEARKLGGNIGDLGLNDKYKLSTKEAAKAAQILNDNVDMTSETIVKATAATSMFKAALISLGAAAAAVALYKIATAGNEIASAASDAGQACRQTSDDIESYQDRIIRLRNTIDDSSSSYEEVYNAQQELYAIQGEMMNQFKSYKGDVDLFNASISDLGTSFDNLKNKEIENTIDDFRSEAGVGFFQKGWNAVYRWFQGLGDGENKKLDNVDILRRRFENNTNERNLWDTVDYFARLTEEQRDLIESVDGIVFDEARGAVAVGTIQEMYDAISAVKKIAVKGDFDQNFIDALDASARELSADLRGSDKALYDQIVFMEDIMKNDVAKEYYQSIIDAREAYNKAVADDNDELILETSEELNSLLDPSNMGDMSEAAKRWFSELYPELQHQFDINAFRVQLTVDPQNTRNRIEVIDALRGYSTAEEAKAGASKDSVLQELADKYKISPSELIDWATDEGLIPTDVEAKFEEEMQRLSGTTAFGELLGKAQKWDKGYKKVVLDIVRNSKTAEEAMQKIAEIDMTKASGSAIDAFAGMTSGLDQISDILADLQDDNGKFDFTKVGTSKFGKEFENVGEEVEKFQQAVLSSKGVMTGEVQQAANELAGAYIEVSLNGQKLTDVDKDVIASMLETMNVTNSEEYATQLLNDALATEIQEKTEAAIASGESAAAAFTSAQAAYDEALAGNEDATAYQGLRIAKLEAAITIGSGEQIAQLASEAEAVLGTANAWISLANAKAGADAFVNKVNSNSYLTAEQKQTLISGRQKSIEMQTAAVQKQLDEAKNKSSAAVAPSIARTGGSSGSSGSGGSGGGGGSDKKKEDKEIDWMERKLKLLQREYDLTRKIADDEYRTYDERIAALRELNKESEEVIEVLTAQSREYEAAYEKTYEDLRKLATDGKITDTWDQDLYGIGASLEEVKKVNDEINATFAKYGKSNLDYNNRPYLHTKDGDWMTMLTEGKEIQVGDAHMSLVITPLLEGGREINLDEYIGNMQRQLEEKAANGEQINLDTLFTLDTDHLIVSAREGAWAENEAYFGQMENELQPLKEKAIALRDVTDDSIKSLRMAVETGALDLSKFPEEIATAVQNMLDKYDKWYEVLDKIDDEEKKIKDTTQEEFEMRLNMIKEQQKAIENEADIIQHSIEMRETSGNDIIRESDYEDLIDNADRLADNYRDQLAVLEEQRASLDEGTAAWYNVVSQIYEVDSALRDVEKQQAEWNETIKQLPIRRIQRYLQMLENIKKDIQNFNSEQSTLGVNPNQQSYTDMFNIGTQQITKYKEELDKLQANLKTYKYGTDKFEETANAIQECQDNVSSLIQEMREYNTAILNIPVDKINEVVEKLQAIQDAMQKVQDDNNTAIEAAITLLSDQMDKYNKEIDDINESYDERIKALQEEQDANQEAYNLEKARYALAKAQGQLTNKVLKNGEWVWQADPEALRDAANGLKDAQNAFDISELEKERDARIKPIQDEIDRLEKLNEKWSQLRTDRDNALTYDTAGDIFGDQNWEEKVLSGNDDALWNKMDQSYEKYLRGIDAYSKTIEDYQQSTALMSTYIAEYNKAIAAANNIQDQTKREQAIRAASDMFAKQSAMLSQDLRNGLTSEENLNRTLGAYNESSSASALNNSANIISTALGEFKTYFGVVADQNVVLSGYAQTWQEIHDGVLAQIEELKKLKEQEDAALELRRQHLANSRHDSDRDANFQSNIIAVVNRSGGEGFVNMGGNGGSSQYYEARGTYSDLKEKGIIHHAGIKTGYIGHMSSDEQLKALDTMASAPLKRGDVPSLLQEGEVVLTQGQQANLLSHLVPLDESDMLSRFTLGPDVLNLNAFRTKKLKGGAFAGNGVQMQQNFNFGDIHVMEAQNVTDIAKGIMNGGLSQALTQQLYKR